ncbi:MAG TPA: SDR family NAD(P)-dependent oxidoreductase, partial [Gemmatimonadaceae bacterium]
MATSNDRGILDLLGRRALVTGASRGIGAATIRLLSAAGADVMVGFRTRSEEAEHVASEARASGVRASTYAADIATPDGAEQLVQACIRELGGIDIFVANAGIWPVDDVSLGDMAPERWHRTMCQNLDSIFFTTAAVTRAIADSGRIVLISST